MIVQRFLSWVKTAPQNARAEAAGALGRAFLYSDMDEEERGLAAVAMSALLDDPSTDVRRALSEALAASDAAPKHIIDVLAQDVAEVAMPVLALSPLLADGVLIDLAASRGCRIQSAIAARLDVSAPLAAALAEVGSVEACIILVRNTGSVLTHGTYQRLVDRFGEIAELREVLLSRPGLPVAIQQMLVRSLAYSLARFAADREWMSPERARVMAGEASERATLAIASERKGADTERLVAHLRDTGQLTPALLLRSLLEGDVNLFEAALSDLSGVARQRVSALLRDRYAPGFDVLYRRAGFPDSAHVAFRAAIDELREIEREKDPLSLLRSKRRMAERVLAVYAATQPGELDALLALLRRFVADARREEARGIATHFQPQPTSAPQQLVAA